MLNYETYADHDSTYNTPPVFGIYLVDLMSQWLLDQGGLEKVEQNNIARPGRSTTCWIPIRTSIGAMPGRTAGP